VAGRKKWMLLRTVYSVSISELIEGWGRVYFSSLQIYESVDTKIQKTSVRSYETVCTLVLEGEVFGSSFVLAFTGIDT
jgi:hypothetical protein